MQNMGKLPEFTDCIVEKISGLPELIDADEASLPLDQLTVSLCKKISHLVGGV